MKISLIILALSLFGCSESRRDRSLAAVWQAKQLRANSSPDCTKTSDCLNGSLCNFQFPGTQPETGTCRTACLSAGEVGGSCAAAEICSPMTGTCEPSCNNNYPPFGINNTVNATPVCSSNSVTTGWGQLSSCSSALDCGTGLVCNGGICAVPCTGNSSGTCPAPGYAQCVNGGCSWNTCANGIGCRLGQACSAETGSGYCVQSKATSTCGDGVVQPLSEACDEGALGLNCSTNTDCPKDWTCPTANGICKPPANNPSAGNGQAGHCSATCQQICAVYVDYSAEVNANGSSWGMAANSINGTHGALSLLSGSAPTNPEPTCVGNAISSAYWIPATDATDTRGSQCPCGYGIWVKKGVSTQAEIFPISILHSLAIYGGFSGTEDSPADRQGAGEALGKNVPSMTVVQGSGSPILSFSSGTMTLDGFQINHGTGGLVGACTGEAQTSCQAVAGCIWSADSSTCSGTPLGNAGGMTIANGTTANLKNLRLSANTNLNGNGGAIANYGTTTLTQSALSMNTAQAGGGIYNGAGGQLTVVQSTFFGNGAVSISGPIDCPSGGRCPYGLICPSGGGACSNGSFSPAPSCASNAECPGGTTCSSGTCTGTFTNPSVFTALGGAIFNADSNHVLNLYGVKFNANYSYGNGGAVYTSSAADMESSLWVGNWASNAGGGVYLASLGSSSTMNNLTFINNSAYNQGGGGIYDVGSNAQSNLSNTLFRDNRGLYPINNSNYLEWYGNRASGALQINSIASDLNAPTANSMSTGQGGNKMTLNYVDLCPIMSYRYNTGSGLSSGGTCDGVTGANTNGLVCGLPNPALQSTISENVTAGVNANSANNTCSLEAELLDCSPPLYRNCSPISGKAISGAPISHQYAFDLNGSPVNGTLQLGAYQSQCGSQWDCPSDVPNCVANTCIR